MKGSRQKEYRSVISVLAASSLLAATLLLSASLFFGYFRLGSLYVYAASVFLSFLILFSNFKKINLPKHSFLVCFLGIVFSFLFAGMISGTVVLEGAALSLIPTLVIHLAFVFPEEKPFYRKSGYILLRLLYLFPPLSFLSFLLTVWIAENTTVSSLKTALIFLSSVSVIFLVFSAADSVRKSESVGIRRKGEHFLVGAFLSLIGLFLSVLLFPEATFLAATAPMALFLYEDFFPVLKETPSRKIAVILLSLLSSSAVFCFFAVLPVCFTFTGKARFFIFGMLGALIFSWSFRYFYALFFSALYKNPKKRLKHLLDFERSINGSESTNEFAEKLSENLKKALNCSECSVYVRKDKSFFVNASDSGERVYPDGFDGNRKDGLVNFIESSGKLIVFDEETSFGFKNVCVEDMLNISRKKGFWMLPFFSGWDLAAMAIGNKPAGPLEKSFTEELVGFSKRISGLIASFVRIEGIEKSVRSEEYKNSKREVIASLKKCSDKNIRIKSITGDNTGNNTVFCLNRNGRIFAGFADWKNDARDWLKLVNLLTFHFVYEKQNGSDLNVAVSGMTGLNVTESFVVMFDSEKTEIYAGNCRAVYLIDKKGVEKYSEEKRTEGKLLFACTSEIMELRNIRYEKLGEARLVEILGGASSFSLEVFSEDVFSALNSWSKDSAGLSDIEMLFVDLTR
ncbi:hypothetical protein JXL83_06570 [candidate division WOR-3 bacterium]|nr:hypothetical protein [candidate division WOR-3 bacterium]